MAAIAKPAARENVLAALRAVDAALTVIADDEGLKPFETDAFISHRATPMLAITMNVTPTVRSSAAATVRITLVPASARGTLQTRTSTQN